MNFRSRRPDRPEFNLIPMIDVLIVLLIFLVMTTTFRRETGLKIRLPQSGAATSPRAEGVEVTIDQAGRIEVNRSPVDESGTENLKTLLATAARDSAGSVVVRADRRTPHEAVMRVLDAASQLGLARISFAMEPGAGAPGTPGANPR
ncbi:MAG: biopolymer transporter ExbD [Gammaproteobacteria bacterium]|nr:biopolymer transporter ExbD [Gammaproteobacteria bacterium]